MTGDNVHKFICKEHARLAHNTKWNISTLKNDFFQEKVYQHEQQSHELFRVLHNRSRVYFFRPKHIKSATLTGNCNLRGAVYIFCAIIVTMHERPLKRCHFTADIFT